MNYPVSGIIAQPTTPIREADRDILATMIHWLMCGEKTQLLTWESTYQGSFKVHNKEELAAQLGLRWDTLQRKMKKLGIWCVPERGCPVSDRVYYFPTDPSIVHMDRTRCSRNF